MPELVEDSWILWNVKSFKEKCWPKFLTIFTHKNLKLNVKIDIKPLTVVKGLFLAPHFRFPVKQRIPVFSSLTRSSIKEDFKSFNIFLKWKWLLRLPFQQLLTQVTHSVVKRPVESFEASNKGENWTILSFALKWKVLVTKEN